MKLAIALLAFIGTFFNLIRIGQAVGQWDEFAVEWMIKVGKALLDPDNPLLEYMTKPDYVANEYNLADRNRLKLDDINFVCHQIALSRVNRDLRINRRIATLEAAWHQITGVGEVSSIQCIQETSGWMAAANIGQQQDAWSDDVYQWLLELGQFMKSYGSSVDTRISYAVLCRNDYEGTYRNGATRNNTSITYICGQARNQVSRRDHRINSRTFQKLLIGCRWAEVMMSQTDSG